MNILRYRGELSMVLIFPEAKGIFTEQYRREEGKLKIVDVFSLIVRGTAVYIESVVSPDGIFEEVEASSFYNFDNLRTITL